MVCLLLVHFMHGQVITQLGFRAAPLSTWILNSTIMAGNGDTTYRISPGFTAGLNFGLFFNKRTYYSHKMKGVQIEISYTGHNQLYKVKPDSGAERKFSTNLGYLDFGLQFQSMPSSDNGFYFTGGPQYSLLIQTNNDRISAGNFQFMMEAGQYFNSAKNTRWALHVGVRASYGITDITTPAKGDSKTYHRSNTVYVGIAFGVDFKLRNYYN